MFGLVWQGQVLKQRHRSIYRSWDPNLRGWMYWFPPYDDESRPDPKAVIETIAQRHNVLHKLGV